MTRQRKTRSSLWPRGTLIQCILVVDQRILRGQKTYIRICNLKQSHDWFWRVDADSPAFDQSLFPHAGQFRKCPLSRDLELLLPGCREIFVVRREVMHEGDVQAVDTESLQTVFNGTSHTRRRVIVDHIVRRGRKREILFILRGLRCFQELATLRGDDVFTSSLVVKKVAESTLRQS